MQSIEDMSESDDDSLSEWSSNHSIDEIPFEDR